MADPYHRIQEHLGAALRRLSLFEPRVTEGHGPSRETARCLADLRSVAEELDQAFDSVKRERQRLTVMAEEVDATMRRARKLFVELPGACIVVNRGSALIEDANAAAARLLNVSQRHLVGKPFTNFLQQDRELFLQQLQRGGEDGAERWHVTLRPRERALVQVLVNAIVETDATAAIVLLPAVHATATEEELSTYPESGPRYSSPGAS
jgi:PAS domain-containing protein